VWQPSVLFTVQCYDLSGNNNVDCKVYHIPVDVFQVYIFHFHKCEIVQICEEIVFFFIV
jgi:hypothetical protein